MNKKNISFNYEIWNHIKKVIENAVDKQVFKEIWKIMLKTKNQDYIKSTKANEINELREQIKLIENESLNALEIINIVS